MELLYSILSGTTNSVSSKPATPNYFGWAMLVILIVVFGVMMFTTSRANKKRQKEAEEKLNSMRVGDRVKTIGGICGIVVEIDDEENTFVLETGKENSGNYIKFDKIAVYQTAHSDDEAAPAPAEGTAESPFPEHKEQPEEAAESAENPNEAAEEQPVSNGEEMANVEAQDQTETEAEASAQAVAETAKEAENNPEQ